MNNTWISPSGVINHSFMREYCKRILPSIRISTIDVSQDRACDEEGLRLGVEIQQGDVSPVLIFYSDLASRANLKCDNTKVQLGCNPTKH
jgi:hypothetical protein